MKKIITYSLLLFLFSFNLKSKKQNIEGTWMLNVITVNADTLFYRNQLIYSLNHNYKLNPNALSNYEDSINLVNQAKNRFENLMNMTIEFSNDSIFSMTKMRSGGRLFPNEQDHGFYHIQNDSIKMINTSRNNYKMFFLLDLKNDRFFQLAGVKDYSVYQEFIRKD